MENTWNFVWNRLFDPRTCMFYNYTVGHEHDAATRYLPEPELIQRLIPNPGGYGTGMEDCMLNAGLIMDAVIARYESTGDETMQEYAAKIYRGMELDANVSPQKGFLPRGVSPMDCQSHYIDTSRDQYTNWFYAAYRLYFSALSTEVQKESIRKCLTAMAEKMETDVIPENHWRFRREDGKFGFVGQMWGDIHPHEALRLPMLYLLTWKTTGELYWKEMYLRYRNEALTKTLEHVPLSGPTYAGLQLQFSVLLVYHLDDDPKVQETCLTFMRKMAEPYEAMAIRKAEELMTPEGAEWLEIPYVDWRKSKFRYAGCWGDYGYFVPEPSDFREHQSYYPLRAVGEGVAVAAMCPGWTVSDAAVERLVRMAEFVDYDRHCTCAPIALIEAYWLTQAKAVHE
ncbi:MAG: hypothetical protein IKI93_06900 [Clostridia bacterium]|nr:hypothetical protein [Clostridia bacterium]